MIAAFSSYWNNYGNFSGTATRTEYWLAYVWKMVISWFMYLISFGLLLATDSNLGSDIFLIVFFGYLLVTLVPNISISTRRLRDAGVPPYLWLLNCVPVVGQILLLILYLQPSQNTQDTRMAEAHYRQEIKRQSFGSVRQHLGFSVGLFAVPAVLSILTSIAQRAHQQNYGFGSLYGSTIETLQSLMRIYSELFATLGVLLLINFAIGILITSGQFVSVDIVRGKENFQQPFQKSLLIFDQSRYLWGVIQIKLLQFIFVLGWSLVGIGIPKQLAYTQAVFIYRDALDAGNPISPLESITKSRQMMDGYKRQLFIIELTLIGWAILDSVTYGFAGLLLAPYLQQIYARFYVTRADEFRSTELDFTPSKYFL